ncbi:MAG: peptidoglycan D,D-transpeptidase FtsI family protein [Lachnospiraceae bacterium]
MRSRIRGMFLVVSILLLVGIWKIFYIINNEGDRYSKVVLDNQTYTSTALASKRGEIIDRNGTVLAYSQKVYNLVLDPAVVLDKEEYKEPTIEALLKCFPKLNRAQLEEILATKPESHYEKLLKELTSDEIAEFQAIKNDTDSNPYVKGVWFEQNYIRKYPYNSLACHVMGFSSAVNGGELGLELYYNDYLSGTDGVQHGYVGSDLSVEQSRQEAVDGNNIITTIDFTVQNILEKHIQQFLEDYATPDFGPGAKVAAAIVMDPNTGDIIGMASSPAFDLNNPRDLSGIFSQEELDSMSDSEFKENLYDVWKNYCVSNIFEPGSTMKNITVSAAIDEGYVKEDDTFICKGYETVGGWDIRCHMRKGHGELDLEGGLIQSCNPAMMQIAARMGADILVMYQERFGFGRKTGIDLPGEEMGLVFDASEMSPTDLATNSFGQNININMVQMITAYCSIVNGGYYYKPHMVKRIETSNGDLVKSFDKELERKVITEETSAQMRKYLFDSVETALAMAVKVDDYSIAGKTGTGQKQPRSDDTYVVSFIGHAPADNPQYAFYFLLDEPNRETCVIGSSVPAIQFAHDTLADLLPYLNTAKIHEESSQDNQE